MVGGAMIENSARSIARALTFVVGFAWVGCSPTYSKPWDRPPETLAECRDKHVGAVTETCQKQHGVTFTPRDDGAPCGKNSDCDSGACHESADSGYFCTPGQCSDQSPCPPGFFCWNRGPTIGSWCYVDPDCRFPGDSLASCVGGLLLDAAAACESDCEPEFNEWFGCIEMSSERLCTPEYADKKCGIARGVLEGCCPACTHSR
jgi:hypothetical protein